MKTITLKVMTVLCFAAGLVGCNPSPQKEKQAPAPATIIKERQAQSENAPRSDAPTTKELLNYYSANLKEARSFWNDCLAKGLKNISGAEKQRCVAAQNAWQNQPYNPKANGNQ